jgi:hypothetical protein
MSCRFYSVNDENIILSLICRLGLLDVTFRSLLFNPFAVLNAEEFVNMDNLFCF